MFHIMKMHIASMIVKFRVSYYVDNDINKTLNTVCLDMDLWMWPQGGRTPPGRLQAR